MALALAAQMAPVTRDPRWRRAYHPSFQRTGGGRIHRRMPDTWTSAARGAPCVEVRWSASAARA
eukprot:156458-Pyramimonas_sp.AAC.1